MKSIKINNLLKDQLCERQLSYITGGSCSCACAYADNGGSSTCDNDNANYDGGVGSPQGGSSCGGSNCDFWRGE